MKRLFANKLVISLIAISLLIVFSGQGWLKYIQSGMFFTVQLIQKPFIGVFVVTDNFIHFVATARRIDQGNRELQLKNQNLLAQVARLEGVGLENEFLRKQLAIESELKPDLKLANIIGHDATNASQSVLIDKGARQGVGMDDVVILAGNILIGQIMEVFPYQAKVRLITDQNSKINAMVLETGVRGIIQGQVSGQLVLDLLPQGEFIEPGQLVVTSGLSEVVPPGLLVGILNRVISVDAETSQKAEIEIAADFSTIRQVFIISR